MNAKTAAEERLLDIALGEVLRETERALATPVVPRRSAWLSAWLAALLAVAAGAAAVLLATDREPPAAATAPQGPRPLPAEAWASDEEQLARLPVDTANLRVVLSGPESLGLLRRFRALRRLIVQAKTAPRSPEGIVWPAMAEDPRALQPLDALSTLEHLRLPFGLPLTSEHLASLRDLPIEVLELGGADLTGDGIAAALAAPRHLRDLRLQLCAVDVELLEAVRARAIARLSLHACPGLDELGWAVIAGMSGLRWLDVDAQNGGSCPVAGRTLQLGTLGAPAVEAIAGLAGLRHLGISESELDPGLLPRLPAGLQSLDLGDAPLSAEAAAGLRRLEALTDLTFGCGLDDAAAEGVLGALSLTRLDYRGNRPGSALLRALAAQERLAELSLHLRGPMDLGPLAKAARLRRLELRGTASWAPDWPGLPDLGCLDSCPELRSLRLFDCGPKAQAAVAGLPATVKVEVVEPD